MRLRTIKQPVASRKTAATLVFIATAACLFTAWPMTRAEADIPPSLKNLDVRSLEDPRIMADFVADRGAAVQLGKALFWDMQLGSDGVTACASCHFQAGSDVRRRNQIAPGAASVFGKGDFPLFGPNCDVGLEDFPLHRRADVDDAESAILRDTTDVMGSQGVFLTQFLGININSPLPGPIRRDRVARLDDPLFNVAGKSTRRITRRNASPVVNAVLNFANFHDGRANNVFNGQNPFGPFDPDASILVTVDGSIERQQIRITNASLASQAVGPPLSNVEMSGSGRTWPAVGKKMLLLRPLGRQFVHPKDSVLGPLSRAVPDGKGGLTGLKGLKAGYTTLIQQAFKPQYWNSTDMVTYQGNTPTISPNPGRPLTSDEYTQMEANFPLFFGLAVQLYESELVSDDTPFDRYAAGNQAALTNEQIRGLGIFTGKGKCVFCHAGFALSSASIPHLLALEPPEPGEAPRPAFMELMGMATGSAFYDTGYYNIAAKRPEEDIGKGATAPFINPLTGEKYPLSFVRLAMLKRDGLLPADVAAYTPDLPPGQANPTPDRVAVDGAIKVPALRNVELNGPYFSNGIAATLMQVVEFYNRGGNFPAENLENLAPVITPLSLSDQEKRELVAFLLSLTDDRVRNEAAPFDHPEIFIANGERGDANTVLGDCSQLKPSGFQRCDKVLVLPATGTAGRQPAGLKPLRPFLDDAGNPAFHFRGQQ